MARRGGGHGGSSGRSLRMQRPGLEGAEGAAAAAREMRRELSEKATENQKPGQAASAAYMGAMFDKTTGAIGKTAAYKSTQKFINEVMNSQCYKECSKKLTNTARAARDYTTEKAIEGANNFFNFRMIF